MQRYIMAGILSGILFGILDGLINANSFAQGLYEVYKPIARTSFNPAAGMGIDIIYGFIMAGIFILLYRSLPGNTGLKKGLSYGLIIWFFRVVMYAASQWMMFEVPAGTVLYMIVSGLCEMLILGIFYGLTLRPVQKEMGYNTSS